MHKAELISALEAFVQEYDLKVASRESGGVGWKGQKSFAQFLIEYFKRLHIPSDEKYDFWRIDDYLPELLVDAFEQFGQPLVLCSKKSLGRIGSKMQ